MQFVLYRKYSLIQVFVAPFLIAAVCGMTTRCLFKVLGKGIDET